MNQLQQLKSDLRFVRAAVETADRAGSPAMIYFLWAVVGLCGFALVDFRQAWVPWYWSIAGPAGFLASAYLGRRHAQRTGQVAAAAASRYLLHRGGMLAAIFLLFLMPMSGLLQWDGLGPTILLILALGYFQAGVHLDRPLLWIGLLMCLGYLFVMFVSTYEWTIVGVLFATALTVAGLRGNHPHEAAA